MRVKVKVVHYQNYLTRWRPNVSWETQARRNPAGPFVFPEKSKAAPRPRIKSGARPRIKVRGKPAGRTQARADSILRARPDRGARRSFWPTVSARQAALRADEAIRPRGAPSSSPSLARVTPAQSAEQGTPRRTCGTPRRTPARRTPAVGCPNQPDVVPRPASPILPLPDGERHRRPRPPLIRRRCGASAVGRRPPGEGLRS